MLTQFLIVCPCVFIAGFIDAIAGGGGLITLPGYMLAGLPPHNAIGTNKLSSCMGSVVSTTKYALSGYINWKTAPLCAVFSLAGSTIGSNLALLIPDSAFKIIMLIALPLIAAYVFTSKKLETTKEAYPYGKTIALCLFIAFIIGGYDGFYGPGTGTFLLLSLTAIARLTLNEAAGTTKVINLMSNAAALAVFIYNGKVIYPLGIVAGLFSMTGNYLGAKAFSKNGVKFVKPVVIIVLALFFAKIIFEFLISAKA